MTLSLHGADIGAVPGVEQLVCFSLTVHQGDLKQSLPFHQEYYEVGKGEGKEWGAIFTKNTETKPIWWNSHGKRNSPDVLSNILYFNGARSSEEFLISLITILLQKKWVILHFHAQSLARFIPIAK